MGVVEMVSRPEAILLDMDDTIIAFEHGVDVDACWIQVCGKHLKTIDSGAVQELVHAIKAQAKWYWSDAERHRDGRMDLTAARTRIIDAALHDLSFSSSRDSSVSRAIAQDYGQVRNEAIYLYNDAIETIRHIRSLGIKLALLTNGTSAEQRYKIERFNLAPLFDQILIEQEVGIGKPDPRVYLHALELLGGVEPEFAWMVGDNYEWEITAPQRLGIRGVWINHKRPLLDPSPDAAPYQSITTLSELRNLLD
ncbi:HAD family hydrolase [Paenibacillus harenae]|uniref:Hydrolase of the HAD superfamily n=1 Tax=Paenibacillus harenae TaxID=306543 RepID=A0ABT9TUX8_PAEHA|nr:HAD family hydrolase [Paenibacillus harenae]MDQ0111172.1 putative hydrolase of the HAD superfamily [Paenibacillus harenae]